MKTIVLVILLSIIILNPILSQEKIEFLEVKGPYLGQEFPNSTPIIFAPGIVSTKHFEHSALSISPDGNEIYWSRMDVPLGENPLHKIYFTERIGDQWTTVQLASFSGINSDDGPKFTSKGKRIYFYSRKIYNSDEVMPNHDIFYIDRKKNGWSEPIKLSGVINTDKIESSPSLTKKGDILFSRSGSNAFYLASKKGKSYSEPVKILNDKYNKQFVNITPFINKEGSVLLFGSVNRSDGFGASDLYVSFIEKGGTWSDPINLGDKINTSANERFPSLSPDGRFLFFVSNRSIEENMGKQDVPQNGLGDIYWVDAKILKDLRKNIPECKLASVVLEKEILNISLESAKMEYLESDDLSFNENKLNTLGYRFLQQNMIQEALFIFNINIQNFPNSANAFDSYAEALLKSGDKKAAIKYYQKSIELNPNNENAKKQLNILHNNIKN